MRGAALSWFLALVCAAAASAEGPVAEEWVVEGRVSENPHAHPIQPSEGQRIVYVDTVAEGQIVAYASETLPEGAWLRLSGTALRFETTSPRPGSTKKFPVKQLTVKKVERLPAVDAVEALVAELGRDDVSKERKQDLQAEIYRAGMDAFPVLIAHRGDARVYEKDRDVQNYMGLPPVGPRPKPILADVTVGSVCSDLLHRLLTPVGYRSKHERVFKPRGSMFLVDDWRAWWLRHRGQTLVQMHGELEPLVDEYFKSGGDPQKVP